MRYDVMAQNITNNQIGKIVFFVYPAPNSRNVPFSVNKIIGFVSKIIKIPIINNTKE
tara:strand:+ start:1307 stop:1477 length:171 start_codon:yes stop_codon:yes gene_type:complete